MAHGVDPILTVIVLQAVKKLHHRLLASDFVRPSVRNAVHSGAQGRFTFTGLKVVPSYFQ